MPLLIQRASAGSGKTEQLARRYLQILLAAETQGHRIDPASILALTFTRKAAGEMLGRIFKVVATACTHEKMRPRIVEGTQLLPPTQEQCDRLLRLLVEKMESLSVETIDALFAKQAQALALDLGIAPRWEIADRHTRNLLSKQAVLRLLEEDPDFSKKWSALHHFTRRISFLEEAAWLLEKNRFLVKVTEEPLVSTLTEQSGPLFLAQEEIKRFRAFLESFAPPLTARGTPNTYWQKALQQLKDICAEPLFLKDVWNLHSLLTKCLQAEPSFYGKPIPPTFLEQVVPLLKASVQEQQRLAFLREEALKLLANRYQRLRSEASFQAGAYTFEEIEALVTEVFPQIFNNDLAKHLESGVEHLLLDEYQDTSQRQHNFLSLLMEEVLAKGGTTFIVGDVKQGIYGWRGGKRYLLHGLEKEYAPYLLSVPPLDESYRSSHAVLAAVNEVFSALSHEEALLKMEADAAFKKAAARWQLDFKPQRRALSLPDLVGRVVLHEVEPLLEEPLQSVLQKVVEIVEAHHHEDPEREIAILVRRTKFIPPLLSVLRSRGILASGEGGNPLADTLAVETLLSLLLWIDHPGHTAALEQVAFSPLSSVLSDSALTLRKKIMTQGLPKMLRTWSAAPAFYEACSSYERERLQQLIALAHRFERTKTLSDFVEHVRFERVESRLNQGVRVLSMHAAKGLEFESVLLMDLDANIFLGAHERLRAHRDNEGGFFIQTSQELMTLQGRKKLLEELHEEQWAEALSLLYVGMTRAISYLDLVILPSSNSSKKSMAQWLRASGLKTHSAAGISWQEQKKASQKIVPVHETVPVLECKTSSLKKLFLRSPTQENSSHGVPLSQFFYDSAASKQGVLKHALLAEIEWIEKLPTAESWATLVADCFAFQKALQAAKELLEQFQQDRQLKSVFECPIAETTLLQVWRERSFAVVLPEKKELLTGRFDRVILESTPEGLVGTIIDFKTAPYREEERAKHLLFYQSQLEAYAKALRQLVPGLRELQTKIVWI